MLWLQIADAVLVWAGFFLSVKLSGVIREVFLNGTDEILGFHDTLWVLYVAAPFIPLSLDYLGFYDRLRQKGTEKALRQLMSGFFVALMVILAIVFLGRMAGASRVIILTCVVLSFLFIFVRDLLTRWYMVRREISPRNRERVLLAGTAGEMAEFLAEIPLAEKRFWNVVGEIDLEKKSIADLNGMIKAESVERVIFLPKQLEFHVVSEAVETCEGQGVDAWISVNFARTKVARQLFEQISEKPMLVVRTGPAASWALVVKDWLDRAGALVLILLTSPLWIYAWWGIRKHSPEAPVLFVQKRAGRFGRPFRMYKFRTMRADAEALLEQVKKEHGNQMSGPVFKLDEDPRVFAFGSRLRKLSIDELPQLLNVLKGDMSLVGPRPLPLYEVEAFERSEYRRRLSVKPGITCEWQAGGRNSITSFEQWVEMDLNYIDNWSLWLDVKILLKTVPAVMLSRGAK